MTIKNFIEPLEVIEAYKPEQITFNTPDEFNQYYRKNMCDFEGVSTYKLNLKYRIPGYRITQVKNKENPENPAGVTDAKRPGVTGSKTLKLIKDYRGDKDKTESDLLSRVTHLEKCIQILSNDIIQLANKQDEILSAIK